MRYIPDVELNLLEEEDLLGTLPYVDMLYDTVKECETPFCIGLFGGWGTGKSTIIKTLEEKIKTNDKEIKVVTYDAWKYSNDSFRRTFLSELQKKLNLKSSSDIKTKFYSDIIEDTAGELKFTRSSWILLIFGIVLIGIVGAVALVGTKNYGLVGGVALVSMFSIIVSIALAMVKEIRIFTHTTIYRSKLFAPEQFEEIFKDIVSKTIDKKDNSLKNKIRKNDKSKKLLIIIDNLDRCDKNTALELMLTIKNFLERKGCVYILPIDDQAIIQYLNSTNDDVELIEKSENESLIKNKVGLSKRDGSEFLRKFFNTTIRIKKLTNCDLYVFGLKLNEKYNLNISNDTINIITQEFADNPRRIIQFFNNLYA